MNFYVPPSGLTLVHLKNSRFEKNHQLPVTVNSMYIIPNTGFSSYSNHFNENQHVYTTDDVTYTIDKHHSHIVADDPKSEPFLNYNRHYIDLSNSLSNTQNILENNPLKSMRYNQISHSYSSIKYNTTPKIWIQENTDLILFCYTSPSKPATSIQWQITQSQLTLSVERKYQHSQIECSISNSEDFIPAKLPTVTVIIEPMYIENIKIQIINETEQTNFREGQLVQFECTAKTNPTTPVYSDYETFNHLIDNQSKLNDNLNDKHEHNLINIQSNANILQLTMNRGMHQKRIRCWIGVETPELLEKITNASLQGVLSNKDSTCELDCRELRNALRKQLNNIIWAKAEYRLDITCKFIVMMIY
ncbi:Irregular chiasm C-roughest protein [Schistosoma japonicum]|nr:Irregular chiasm C-roughest protein [Schistosoma japonicum]